MHGDTHHLFWGTTGALLGVGMIGILTIGMPFLLAGTIMLFYGIFRRGPRGFWAALVGFGVIPAFFLLTAFFTVERCLPGARLTLPADAPPGAAVSCGSIADGTLPAGVSFVAIALTGAVWGVIESQRRSGSKRPNRQTERSQR